MRGPRSFLLLGASEVRLAPAGLGELGMVAPWEYEMKDGRSPADRWGVNHIGPAPGGGRRKGLVLGGTTTRELAGE